MESETRKFKLKDIAGHWVLIFEFALQIFLMLLGIIVILVVGYISAWKPNGEQRTGMIFFAIWSGFWLLMLIFSLIFWGRRLMPFMKKDGLVVMARIRERSFFGVMYGDAVIDDVYVPVKIYFSSLGDSHFFFYSDGEYVRCFVRNEDLPRPKTVIMYQTL